MVDNNSNGVYDVVIIDEYSFVIDRISRMNKAVYFVKDMLFRDKSVFRFDYEDSDKEYYIYNDYGEEIQFEDIKSGSVMTLRSSMDELINLLPFQTKRLMAKLQK